MNSSRRFLWAKFFTFLFCIIAFQSSLNAQIFNSTWAGGTGVWNDPANWSTADFPHNNGTEYYNAFISGAGDQVNYLGVYTIDSLDIGFGGILDLGNNASLTIVNDPGRAASGVLNNGGTIGLNATSLGSTLRFDGTVSLTGGGTIAMSNDAGNRLSGTNNGLLINEDNIIRGSGTIGISNTLAFENRGILTADQAVAMNLVLSQGVVNEGLFNATNGATLNLTGGHH